MIARVTSSLSTASGAVGSSAMLTVATTQADGLVDDSAVQRVSFGDDTRTSLARALGVNAWSMTLPPGAGTVPVTFDGGLAPLAGTLPAGPPALWMGPR